jgi:hypothetical protein
MSGRLGLAAVVSTLTLALAGPAGAATHAGSPSPDPSPPASGAGAPSPDPVPQATGAGSVIQGAASQGAVSQGSGTPSISVQVPYAPPRTPQLSHPASSTTTSSGSATAGADRTPAAATSSRTTATNRPAHTPRPHRHVVARPTAGQREAALASEQLRQRLALDSRTAGPISAAATLTSAPAHRDGTVLLIGAGVLLVLAAASGALLRRLWRLHGQWYGGRPA